MGKLLLGVGLALLLLCRPEDAANGAREALCQWYYVVAPSLYPFMALMPLLTCPEANRFYDAALGGVMRKLFGLPGSAASPVIVGMIAGSPAGCAAARAVAMAEGYTRGQLERVAVACCGMSPAFFVSAVGAGMLGDVGMGHVLLRSQALAQVSMLALTGALCRDGTGIPPVGNDAGGNPVLTIINVAGTMALFGAIAGALRLPWLCLALEITAGSRWLCAANMEVRWRLAALSALAGYGGLCVCAQNIGVLRDCGVKPVKLVLARCLAGALAAGFSLMQTEFIGSGIPSIKARTVSISCILAVFLAVPAVFRLRKTIF